MASNNPFDELFAQGPTVPLDGEQTEEGQEPEVNPFDQLFASPIEPRQLAATGETGIERLFEGIGRGALTPVRAFTEKGESEGIAGAVGEFIGAGLAFVPFFRGAQAITRGLGFTRGAGAAFFEGAIATGAFEAFAGEDWRNAPVRAVVGGVLGGVGDVALMRAAGALRSRYGRYQPVKSSPTKAIEPDVNIHPDALKIEEWIRPKGFEGETELAAKLRSLNDPEKQVQHAMLELTKGYMPGGHVVLPGIDDPRPFARLSPKMGLRMSAHRRRDGRFDVLLFDEELIGLQPRLAVAMKKFLGEGEPALTFDEAIELIRGEGVDVQTPNLIGGRVNLYGQAWLGPPERIKVALGTPKAAAGLAFETLVHEYMHLLTARTRQSASGANIGSKLQDVFDISIKRRDAELRSVTDEVFSSYKEALLTQGRLRQEFLEATVHVRARLHQELDGVSWAKARELAEEEVLAELRRAAKPYVTQDQELLSRMAELMFIDPKLARKIAPRATRLMSRFINQRSPIMRELMTKEQSIIDDWLRELWVKRDQKLTAFQRSPFEITREQLQQFNKTGFFQGMEVVLDGRTVTVVGRPAPGKVSVRDITSGKIKTVDESKISRPLAPRMAEQRQEVISKIREFFGQRPGWISFSLFDWDEKGLRRAVLEFGDDFEWTDDAAKWLRQFKEGVFGEGAPDFLQRTDLSTDEQIIEALKAIGKKGLVVNDNGLMEIHIADPQVVQLSDHVISSALGREAGTILNGTVPTKITPSVDDMLKSFLREEGVSERDLEYFLQTARREHENMLMNLVDEEVKELVRKAKESVEAVADDADALMDRAGMHVEESADGMVHVRDNRSGVPIGVFADRDQAAEYAARSMAPDAMPALDDGAPIRPTHGGNGGAGGGGRPPKFQQQIPDGDAGKSGWIEKIIDTQSIFGAVFTAMENFAKAAERRGFGPAYTVVFRKGQEAILNVDRELAAVKREKLGNISFNEHLKKIEKMMRGMPRERKELISRYIEAMSREEVAAPGGLLQRGMTESEIKAAQFIEQVGLQHDIPRLMSTDRLIQSALRSQTALKRTIQRFERIKTSPEVQELLGRMRQAPEFADEDAVMDFLGLSKQERDVIRLLREQKKLGKDQFSIFAVSRYAAAKPLKKGFKTGRDQFAAEFGMTSREIAVAREFDKLFEQTFALSGMSAKRQIGGFWPHMRQWAQHGFEPSLIPGLKDELPDTLEWISQRFRTGELDVYEMDPLITGYKHVRSMLMKQHFDPILPELKQSIDEIRTRDPRTARIMDEYVQELLGRPHQSFRRVQQIIDGSAKALGVDVGDRTVEHFVNGLVALSAAATIPFRPALIIRNYYQMVQTVAPRTGMRNFWKAVRYVTSPETRKEAMRMASEANAIQTHVLPIHAATEVFGSPAVGGLNYRLQLMLEKGFGWYQSADDMGRAVAFHAQRFRMQEHIGDLARGHISLDEFAKRAKVLTFDPLDQQIAFDLLLSGKYEEAKNHLGTVLARETIFRYGHANHPAGWNSVAGRLFGQFGTWPTQYKDYLLQGLTRGTAKDRMEFLAIHGAANAGILAAGSAVGLNLWSWLTFPSLMYTGGPMAEMTVDVIKAMSGSDTEKALARRNLEMQIPLWNLVKYGKPQSIFVPGSYLLGDLMEMFQQQDALSAAVTGAGFTVMRPDEKSALDRLFEGI